MNLNSGTEPHLKMKTLNFGSLITSVAGGLIASLLITGFIYGFIACFDCGWSLEGMLWRSWIGIMNTFLTVITLGKPWTNEGGSSSVNLQPYVLLVCVLISYLIYRRMQRSKTSS
jgi:hypothetical protein